MAINGTSIELNFHKMFGIFTLGYSENHEIQSIKINQFNNTETVDRTVIIYSTDDYVIRTN